MVLFSGHCQSPWTTRNGQDVDDGDGVGVGVGSDDGVGGDDGGDVGSISVVADNDVDEDEEEVVEVVDILRVSLAHQVDAPPALMTAAVAVCESLSFSPPSSVSSSASLPIKRSVATENKEERQKQNQRTTRNSG